MSQGANRNNNVKFKNRADKLMAIKRNDEFKKDYENLLKIRQTGDEERIIRKEYEIGKKWGESVYAIEKAEEFYHSSEHLPTVMPVTSLNLPREPLRVLYEVRDDVEGKDVIIEQPLAGERLYLEVDIKHFSVPTILKDVEKIARHYKGLLKDTSRNKGTMCDPWKIYDLKHNGGLTLLQIAKKLYGFKKNPAYDEDAHVCFERVRSAYNKACRMIMGVSPL